MTLEIISDGRYWGVIEYYRIAVNRNGNDESDGVSEVQVAVLKDLRSLSRSDILTILRQKVKP